MRWHVISAVFSRNVKQYFSGVLGYLFIVVFVMVGAIMAFSEQFFADNLSNLDQLSRWYPKLLLVFIPAITMNIWADEKRQGTDAILFTLPASDFEILLGKYLSLAAVYTIALLFSSTQLIALWFIGQPDWGVVVATYVGYWLSGLALLAIGMFASSLTSIVPVAFVLGALLCSAPVFAGQFFESTPKLIEQYLPESISTYIPNFFGLEQFGIDWNLQDFTLGLVPLANIVYFVSIIAFMLYLNLVVISRRHWSRGQQLSLGGQFAIRVVSLAIALVSFNYIVNQASSSLLTRLDLTAEGLYTLDETTIRTLAKAKEDERTVSVQAFVSRDVPRSFVNTKKQFTGLLRQYEYYGGNNVEVEFIDVLPFSDAERQAQQLGIEPHPDRSEVSGRVVEQDVYLGALISSSQGDAVLPFIENDSSIEYQLTQSIATTTDKDQKITLGIVETDTFFAGPEIEGRRLPWAYSETYDHLKTQYRIKHIRQDDLASYVVDGKAETADEATDDDAAAPKTAPDVLLVSDPSSLSDAATNSLLTYLDAGNPVIFLADPLPFYWTTRNPTAIGVLNAPRQPRLSQRSPYVQVLASTLEPKADQGLCTKILDKLGLEWDSGTVAWNLFDPHPNFKGAMVDSRGQATWPEYFGSYESAFVFVKNHAGHNAFETNNAISSALKEVLFFYPGSVRPAAGSELTFTPLITLEKESGTTTWDALTTVPTQVTNRLDPRTGRIVQEEDKPRSQITGEDLRVINPEPVKFIDSSEHVIAAHIGGSGETPIRAVFIADLDFVSDLYGEQIANDALEEKLDNVSLLQNAIDVLAGKEDFVVLRNRRPDPRTLAYVERETDKFRSQRAKAQEEIEKDIRQKLQEEQDKLDVEAKKIEGNTSLSFLEKLQRTSQEASDAQRRFELKKEKLDISLEDKINALRSEEQNKIRRTEGFVKLMAIGFAPLPAFLLGCLVLLIRVSNERSQVKVSRRV